MRLTFWLLITGLALAGCVAPPPPYPPVPAPLAETIPLPPLSSHTLNWQPGHWDWTGRDYRWAEGRYVDRAGHGPLWTTGYWARMPSGAFAWIPAHWN